MHKPDQNFKNIFRHEIQHEIAHRMCQSTALMHDINCATLYDAQRRSGDMLLEFKEHTRHIVAIAVLWMKKMAVKINNAVQKKRKYRGKNDDDSAIISPSVLSTAGWAGPHQQFTFFSSILKVAHLALQLWHAFSSWLWWPRWRSWHTKKHNTIIVMKKCENEANQAATWIVCRGHEKNLPHKITCCHCNPQPQMGYRSENQVHLRKQNMLE